MFAALLFGIGTQSTVAAQTKGTAAIRVADFLNSIGTQSAISVRGEKLQKTIECARYLGVHWFRSGIEGSVPVEQFAELHKQAGLKFSWGLGSGGSDIQKLTETARQVAASGALLSFEGPNEPNNWGIKYKGESGGRDQSWIPVANLQRDLYRAVKADPILKHYPVWSISENGAETNNVGLQYLTIPLGAGTAMPDGTVYADYANVHNYIYHPNSPGVEDNKTWHAADPSAACKVDGLYGEYGRTWLGHFSGYTERQLETLPRVTTETGCTVDGPVTEEIHGLNLLSLYLDQFKRGWSYSCVYLLRDRVDEAGNQQFGFFKPDYTPRKAGVYLHNLTTVLKDSGFAKMPGRLNYSISNQTETVHDMLLQKSDGSFELIVWDERAKGSDSVVVHLGKSFPSVNLYDVTLGPTAIVGLKNVADFTLTLTDHPMIIEIPAA